MPGHPRSKVDAQQLQSMPLGAKVVFSQKRIRAWYEMHDGMVYVATSGGVDSTVLLDLVRELYPEVPAVFFDTGLEFPEIREFVATIPTLVIRKPALDFRSTIRKYGYPIISKRMAQYIREARRAGPKSSTYKLRTTGIKTDGTMSPMGAISKKWRWLADDATVPISEKCCYVMKKRPAALYEKETGRVPFVGTMAEDSSDRLMSWINKGCNYVGRSRRVSTPLMPWLKTDIWDYIRQKNLPYCKVYDMGYKRTGCVFCAFGVHLDRPVNRFQILARTHPHLWEYCMETLGLAAIADHIFKGKVKLTPDDATGDLFKKEGEKT